MTKKAVVPAAAPVPMLGEVRRRIEHWRRTRRCRTTMPEELWSAAAAVAQVAGLNATARALRLDYYSLKARVEKRSSAARQSVTFVEARLPPTPPPSGDEYLVELERVDGGRMRARVSTIDALAVLSESFWRGRS